MRCIRNSMAYTQTLPTSVKTDTVQSIRINKKTRDQNTQKKRKYEKSKFHSFRKCNQH